MKFGKLAPKFNSKTLLLSKYLTSGGVAVPPAPNKVWREWKVSDWQMFGNDTIGDCTCAAIAHMLMLVTIHTNGLVTPTLEDVIQAYRAVSGYDPATGMNDNGAAITDVLEYWRTQGIAGHKILGWAQVDHKDPVAIKQATWLFGGVDIGIVVPSNAIDQFSQGLDWTLTAQSIPTNDGHSIPIFGYGSRGASAVTWGRRQGMDWPWFLQFCEEAYAVITQDWMDQATGLTPSGFNLAQLKADLNALTI